MINGIQSLVQRMRVMNQNIAVANHLSNTMRGCLSETMFLLPSVSRLPGLVPVVETFASTEEGDLQPVTAGWPPSQLERHQAGVSSVTQLIHRQRRQLQQQGTDEWLWCSHQFDRARDKETNPSTSTFPCRCVSLCSVYCCQTNPTFAV